MRMLPAARVLAAARACSARVLLAAAALLALAGTARAAPELGLRLGVALPLGDTVPDVALSEQLGVQFPVQLDALWRADRFAAGGYGSWGPGGAGTCDAGASCDGSSWRAGVQATYALRAAGGRAPGWEGFQPWAGVGAGWEWTTHRQRADGEVLTAWNGPEISAQGGVEWRVGRRLALGPVLLVGLGRYRHLSVETPFDSGSTALPRRSIHAWVHLGARARLALGPTR